MLHRGLELRRFVLLLPITVALLLGSATATKSALAETTGPDPRNIVVVQNLQNDAFRMKSKVQLNVISGSIVAPENFALVNNSCLSCQSIAVALQLNVYSGSPNVITPQNAAIAVNAACDGCFAYAKAAQASIRYDGQLPSSVQARLDQLTQRLNDIEYQARKDFITPVQAQTQILGIVSEFWAIVYELDSSPLGGDQGT